MKNVKYSKINQKTLEEYYSKFFIDKEKCKRQLVAESLILIIGSILSLITILPFIYLFLNWVFSFFPDVDLGPANLLLIPLAFIVTYKSSEIYPWLGRKLCPLAYRYEIEQGLKKELQEYNQFFEFQNILKNREVCRILIDKEFLKVEYTEQNGIFSVFELSTMKYNLKIVTEKGLDFSWLDKEIENLVAERTGRTLNGVLVRKLEKVEESEV